MLLRFRGNFTCLTGVGHTVVQGDPSRTTKNLSAMWITHF